MLTSSRTKWPLRIHALDAVEVHFSVGPSGLCMTVPVPSQVPISFSNFLTSGAGETSISCATAGAAAKATVEAANRTVNLESLMGQSAFFYGQGGGHLDAVLLPGRPPDAPDDSP